MLTLLDACYLYLRECEIDLLRWESCILPLPSALKVGVGREEGEGRKGWKKGRGRKEGRI